MQKVVGSSPIIRFAESPAHAGFFLWHAPGAAGFRGPRAGIVATNDDCTLTSLTSGPLRPASGKGFR
jgi:hypothetical protein